MSQRLLIDYAILGNDDERNLQRNLLEKAAAGYELIGGASLAMIESPSGERFCWYCQAMALYAHEIRAD